MRTESAQAVDDERVDAARDLLKLFARARHSLIEAYAMRRADVGDPRPMLAAMRCRLSDAVMDDCLLFDERGMLALFDFVGAWRAASEHTDAEKARETYAVFKRAYQRAAAELGACLR